MENGRVVESCWIGLGVVYEL